MQVERLTELLRAVQAGQTSVDAALDVLRDLPYETVADYARLDHHRSLRIGLPEVIYGAGKTPEQIARLLERLTAANGLAVATRVSAEQAQAVQALLPAALYHAMPRILTLGMAP
ncbi:MAG: 1-(5-phosphoribosyl)-5-amino-4-imidazole-carboxylate carboxylase, partial [Anaerolineae bacterium]